MQLKDNGPDGWAFINGRFYSLYRWYGDANSMMATYATSKNMRKLIISGVTGESVKYWMN